MPTVSAPEPPGREGERLVYLESIAQYLPISDLKSFRLVSKEWELASQVLWWTNPTLRVARMVKDLVSRRYLSISDLKSFRLGCKEWNNCFLKEWRSNAVLTVLYKNCQSKDDVQHRNKFRVRMWEFLGRGESSAEGVNVYREYIAAMLSDPLAGYGTSHKKGVGMYELYKLYHSERNDDPLSLKQYPFNRYKVKDWTGWEPFGHVFYDYLKKTTTSQKVEEPEDDANWFIRELLGTHAKYLELELCEILSPDNEFLPGLRYLTQLETLVLKKTGIVIRPQTSPFLSLPKNRNLLLNLKQLKLDYTEKCHRKCFYLPNGLRWASFFNATPNLESFWYYGPSPQILIEMLDGMSQVRQNCQFQKLNIKELLVFVKPGFTWRSTEREIIEASMPKLMAVVVDLKFPLRTLGIGLGNFKDESGLLPNLLKTFEDTLELLYIERRPYSLLPSNLEMYPLHQDCKMNRLKTLQLVGTFSPSAKFIKLMPNLEVFCTSEARLESYLDSRENPIFMLNGEEVLVDTPIPNFEIREEELREMTQANYMVQTIHTDSMTHKVVVISARQLDWKKSLPVTLERVEPAVSSVEMFHPGDGEGAAPSSITYWVNWTSKLVKL